MNYSYKGGGYTKIDNLLNPYWIKLAEPIPEYITPNMITLSGLLCSFSGILVLLLTGNNPQEERPAWVYLYLSLVVFLYQTIDALDGKQGVKLKVKRIHEWEFDHHCDAISLSFMTFFVLHFIFIKPHTVMLIIILALNYSGFFISSFVDFYTGSYATNSNEIGVTELQLSLMLLGVIAAVFGKSLWEISLFGLQLNTMFLITQIVLCIY